MNRKLIRVMVLSVLLSSVFSAYSQGRLDGSQNSEPLSSDMVLIKGETFRMGSPESESWRETDELLHTVTVNDFYISKYELSQKEYSEITGTNPSGFKGDNLPVESVTWYDAVEYCNALSRSQGLQPAYRIDGKNVEWDRAANGYRLPTEAEWGVCLQSRYSHTI